MAKIKTKTKSGSGKSVLNGTNVHHVKSKPKYSSTSIEDLLTQAASLLEQSQADLALPLAEEALRRLEAERRTDQDIEELLQLAADGKPTYPQALVLAADVSLALGDAEGARRRFSQATDIDPDGALVSAEPWLWLSQLSEQGGKESVQCFDRGTEVLRNEIEVLAEAQDMGEEHTHQILDDKRLKLSEALCGMAEVYMTDLSWEPDAEERCEQLVTEAVAVCPERLGAGVLQTLASVRISQERIEEARKALAESMSIWKDLPADIEDAARPDFATRVSLTRLLMDVDAEVDALFVLESLIKEDDQSVECCYLRGWCHFVLSQKTDVSEEDHIRHAEMARTWLGRCLKLFKQQQYEDDKLQAHALELVGQLNKELDIDDGDEAWEDEDDDDEQNELGDGNDDLEVHADVEHMHEDVEMT